VAPADYDRVCAELSRSLEQIPDDRGQPLRTRAWMPRDLYRQVNGVPPDLIVIFGDLAWRAVGTMGYNSLYLYDNDTGPDEANHAQYGFFNWTGPALSSSNPSSSLSTDIDILEIAPTVLRQMGVPVLPSMLGKPLDSARPPLS
jgi:predicted AlkP superfamily phosphohydrolase/phosphomutase